MGWRPGQGVGPRLTYAQRRKQDAGFLDPTRPSGDAGEGEGGGGDGDDAPEEAKRHMYPRRDVPVLVARRKDNFHGLGYDPGMGLSESVGAGAGAERDTGGPRIAGASLSLGLCRCGVYLTSLVRGQLGSDSERSTTRTTTMWTCTTRARALQPPGGAAWRSTPRSGTRTAISA